MYRPTKNSIWNSFLASGKRHLILTGGKGSGKSTLLSSLFGPETPGLTSIFRAGTSVYLRENPLGRTGQIGVYDTALSGSENKMRPLPRTFTEFGIPALRRCADASGDWVSIDEIGYLEASSPEYMTQLGKLMQIKRLGAALRKQALLHLTKILSRDDVFTVDLDAPFGNCGCVIMASGKSVRFGANKLMADFGGKPMIERILRATEGIFTHRVVVTRDPSVREYCDIRGVETVFHDLPGRDDTVRLGLQAVGSTDGCVFCPADQPLLRRETLASLCISAAAVPGYIYRPAFGTEAGAPVLFPYFLYTELCNLPTGKGGGVVLKKYPDLVRSVQVEDPHELSDVDTTEDLARLLRYERME